MTYLNTFKIAFLLFPIVAFLVTIPFILQQYHKYGSINKLRTLIIYSFILYLMTTYFLVILPLPDRETVLNMPPLHPQLIPFKFVIDFLKETPFIWNKPSTYLLAMKNASFYTIIFNVFMTIPFGMYLRYYFKCDLKKTIKINFLLSLFFEFTQYTGLYFIYPRAYRLFDVDDLIINTLGGYLGYILMGCFTKILPTRQSIDDKTFESSKNVSGLRRLTSFFIDVTIYLILIGLISIFTNFNKYLDYLLIFLYFVIMPTIWDGKTIGRNFVNIKLSFPNNSFFHFLFRTISFILYYNIPLIIITSASSIITFFNINATYKIAVYCILLLFTFMYYLVNLFLILNNHQLFYNQITKTTYVSTLKNNKNTTK